MDNTLYKMKEVQIIQLKKRVEGLTNIVKKLIQEIQANTMLAKGTLTAFQLHIGEEEWEKLVEELKDVEKRNEEKKFETPSDVE
tara:strand:+ start:34 stop:285 length:252 start_codon:yes stop_codon:yes gene_type:complete